MSASLPPDWMVLQCGACDTRMKVRRDTALKSRLLCPQCRTPVAVAEPERPVISPEFSPTRLPVRESSGPAPPRMALPHREDSVIQGSSFRVGPGAGAPRPDPPASRREDHADFDGRLVPRPAPDGRHSEAEEEEEEEEEDDGKLEQGPVPALPGIVLPDRKLAPGEMRRVKIKKRRAKRPPVESRSQVLMDWDQRDLTAIPDAELAADVWGEAQEIPEEGVSGHEAQDYLVETVVEPDGQTRTTRRRVRRRRLIKGSRLFFQRLSAATRYAAAALAVLAVGAAFYGFNVSRQKHVPVSLPPVVEPPIDRAILTQYDEQGAVKAVNDFLAADGIGAKLPFVRQPERVRPLMERWYRGERSAAPLQAGEVTFRDKQGGEAGSAAYYVLLAMPVQVPDPLNPGSTSEEQTFFAVEEIRDGPVSQYLVDWETSTGYQEMPLETFKATMPPEAWPFRIRMKEESYYNHGFSELDWQCVELYYPGRDFHLYGYISRNSLEGRALLPLVAPGRTAGVIAELAYPPDAASRDQVIVKRMLHPSWFYDKPEDAAVPGAPPPLSKPK